MISTTPKRKKSVTLAEEVKNSLTQKIRQGTYPPGTKLPTEPLIMAEHGVSRTVVREAVSRLKSEGLVESRQGSGVFVRDRNVQAPFRIDPSIMDSIQSVLQVVELRQSLEGEIAALAAKRRTREQMAAIKRTLKQIELDEQSGKDGVEGHLGLAEPHRQGQVDIEDDVKVRI